MMLLPPGKLSILDKQPELLSRPSSFEINTLLRGGYSLTSNKSLDFGQSNIKVMAQEEVRQICS